MAFLSAYLLKSTSYLKYNDFILVKQLYIYIRFILKLTSSKLQNHLKTFRSSIIIFLLASHSL